MPFDIVPIIDVPGYGSQAAVKACLDRNVKDQHDKLKLEEAKKEVYLKGFNEGVMLVGDYKGLYPLLVLFLPPFSLYYLFEIILNGRTAKCRKLSL